MHCRNPQYESVLPPVDDTLLYDSREKRESNQGGGKQNRELPESKFTPHKQVSRSPIKASAARHPTGDAD